MTYEEYKLPKSGQFTLSWYIPKGGHGEIWYWSECEYRSKKFGD